MKPTTLGSCACALALLVFMSPMPVHAQTAGTLSAQEAKQIAIDAYIYGYSLITSDVTQKAFTNTTARLASRRRARFPASWGR